MSAEEVRRDDAFLVVDHLRKAYGPNVAVEDLSFSLVPGKIYGLLGPNGAGKSTTMNIMTGYIGATGGTVTVGGYDIFKNARKAKREIGYLPEQPPVYPDMTVFEYLKFAAELKGVPKKDRLEAVDDVMEEADIMDVSDRMIRNLSKGYKQRVGFAQAILGNPKVIILDEPTVGLDPRQIMEFRELIRKLGEDHIVLLSSHIMQEISAVCDHVFIIANGKLLVDDDVANLSAHMGDGVKLVISAKGDEAAARNAVSAVDGVETVDCQTSDDGTLTINVSIASENAEDIKENISLSLMEQRIPIFEMKEEADSLESIFLEVTESEVEEGSEAEGTIEADPETEAGDESLADGGTENETVSPVEGEAEAQAAETEAVGETSVKEEAAETEAVGETSAKEEAAATTDDTVSAMSGESDDTDAVSAAADEHDAVETVSDENADHTDERGGASDDSNL